MVEKNKKYNKKKSFSLLAVIALLIIVFISLMLSMPLISKRHQNAAGGENEKGKYICYRANDNRVHNVYYSNGSVVRDIVREDNQCNFEAPSNVDYISIQLVGGGSGGSGIPRIGENGFLNVTGAEYSDQVCNTGFLPNSFINLKSQLETRINSMNAAADCNGNSELLDKLKEGLFNPDGSYKYADPLSGLPAEQLKTSCRHGAKGTTIDCSANITWNTATFPDLQGVTYSSLINNSRYFSSPSLYTLRKVSLSTSKISYMAVLGFSIFRNGSSSIGSRSAQCGSQTLSCTYANLTADNLSSSVIRVPYYRFEFRNIDDGDRRLYSGRGGNPGEIISHITTNLGNINNITLGFGGQGGNCYDLSAGTGDFEPQDCIGKAGGETRVVVGSDVLVAKGGSQLGLDEAFEGEDYSLPAQPLDDNHLTTSSSNIIRFRKSKLNQSDSEIQAGNGGPGAGERDMCRVAASSETAATDNDVLIATKLYKYNYAFSSSSTTSSPDTSSFGAGTLVASSSDDLRAQNGTECYDDERDFKYVKYSYDNGTELNDIPDGHIGQNGQHGAVIITW